MIKLVSWNVNGLRAIARKGFLEMVDEIDADIVCLQEIKTEEDQLTQQMRELEGYEAYFNPCLVRKGYSGTAVYTRLKPKSVRNGLGDPKFDDEGRIQLLEFDDFWLYNIYYPNGQMSPERLQYKLDFYDYFLKHTLAMREQGRPLIICGDVNTAHHEIDLARPKANSKTSGFLPEERAWLDRFVESGLIDTFRIFTPEGDHYSWWDYKTRARERNVGWRIDYFYITPDLRPRVVDAAILNQYMGSDHCPISLVLHS